MDQHATWACIPGFRPAFIFPFTDAGSYGVGNRYEFQALLYRPLYWMGRDGLPEIDFGLSLAEPPEWSADGRTATITLKRWRWSNGEVLGPDHVMLWMHLFEVNKTHHGGYTPGCLPDNLVSYGPVGRDRVAFTFDRAYSPKWVLMNQLSLITPLPKAWDRTADGPADATRDPRDARAVYEYLMACNADRASYSSSPIWRVVNGPWRLKNYDHDEGAVYVPNEHYDGPVKPQLAEFRQRPTASDHALYETLRSGEEVHVGFLPFERADEPLDEHYRLVPQNLYKIHYIPLNFRNPTAAGAFIRQLYFRQALQSVVDQPGMIRELYPGYGYPTTGPVPLRPDSDLLSPARRAEPYPFDVARARALLSSHGWDVTSTPARCVDPERAGAGISLGDELRVHLRYAEGHRTLERALEKLRRDAAAAGIAISASAVDGDALARETTGAPALWELASWNGGWVHDYPTGELLFRTGAATNFGGYSDVRADALIEATLTGDDLDALHAFQDYVAEQVPVIWMPNFPFRLMQVAHGLEGVEPVNPFGLINPENWFWSGRDGA